MAKPKGYKLPEVIDPPDNICLAVEVPNDPAYIAAFYGAYEWLGYWFAWQRDPLKLGKDAAARWRLAVEETHANWDRYGDLYKLIINVNCGCCNEIPTTYTPVPDVDQITGPQAGEIVILPTDLIDDGLTPPTLSFPDYDSYLAWKCQIATELADDILETFNRLGGLGVLFASVGAGGLGAFLTAGSLTSAFVGFLAAFLTPVGAVALIIGILAGALLAGIRALQYFHEIRDQVPRDELICLLYTAHSPTEARAAFMDRIATAYPAVPWEGNDQTVFTEMFENLMDAVAPDELFALLFEAISDYDTGGTFDCSQCDPGAALEELLIVEEGSLIDRTGDVFTFQSFSRCEGQQNRNTIKVWINVDMSNAGRPWIPGGERLIVSDLVPSRAVTSGVAYATYNIYRAEQGGSYYTSDTQPSPSTEWTNVRGIGILEQDFYNPNCQNATLDPFTISVQLLMY